MKSQLCSIVCLLVLAAACGEARPKRSVYYATAPVVASVPVVHSAVVHSHPTTVVKTEQVRSGDHASYSYHSEVKSEPIVHTHTHAVAAAPVAVAAAAAPTAVVTTHHHAVAAVPSAYHYGYYPTAYSYYSPYSYVVGK